MPYVNTTFLPKTNGMVFSDRLAARAAKGRVFLYNLILGFFEGPVEVTSPADGDGLSGDGTLYNPISSPITSVGGSGTETVTTDVIQTDTVSPWADALSAPSGLFTGSYADQFDGDLTTFAVPDKAAEAFSFAPPGAFILTQNVRVYAPSPDQFKYAWTIGSDTGLSSFVNATGWYELTGTSGKTFSDLQPLEIGSDTAGTPVKFSAIEVNGQVLTSGAHILTFASDTGFSSYHVGDVVQSSDIALIAKDASANEWTVSGGTWTVGNTVSKTVNWDAELTCSSDTKLAVMEGPITMSDASGGTPSAPGTATITAVDEGPVTGTPPITTDPTSTGSWGSAFNGVDTGYAAAKALANAKSIANFDPPLGVGATSIVVKFVATRFSPGVVECNGTNLNQGFGWVANGSVDVSEEVDVTSLVGAGGITSLSTTNNLGDTPAFVKWVKVDGTIVNLASDYFDGDTTVTFSSSDGLDAMSVGDEVQPGVLITDIDTANNQLSTFGGLYTVGGTLSGETPSAGASTVVNVSGNTLRVSGVSGEWKTTYHIKGSQVLSYGIDPTAAVFTSANDGTAAVTGTDAPLKNRIWVLENSDSQSGPWTSVGQFTDNSATASQDGSVPWGSAPALVAGKFYRVKVKYTSNTAPTLESAYNTFKTSD